VTSQSFFRSCAASERGNVRGLTMADTYNVASCITRLITAGTPALSAAVVSAFPNLTPAEFGAAVQTATAQAERQAALRH
jgi:hypothetical protein